MFNITQWTNQGLASQGALVAPSGATTIGYAPPGGASPITVGAALDAYRSGEVRMVQDFAGVWVVYDPWGNVVPTGSSTSMGLQEAFNTARSNHWNLHVIGQGNLSGQVGQLWGTIHCTAPLTTGPLWGQYILIEQVNLVLDPATPANTGWTIDSADFSSIFVFGQVLYTGTGVGVNVAPTTDNGESFIGWTTSLLYITTCVCIVSNANWSVDTTKGGCISISPGTHAVVNNQFIIGENNGGVVGLRIDSPGAAGQFSLNYCVLPGQHSQSTTCLQVGTGVPAGTMTGNHWIAMLSGASNGLITYSSKDTYELAISGGSGTGVTFQTSASRNKITCPLNLATTPTQDASTNADNYYNSDGLATQYSLTGAAQVVSAANVYTQVKFDTYVSGAKSIYTVATGVVNPGDSGLYDVFAQFYVTSVAAGNYVDVTIYKNGALAYRCENLAAGTTGCFNISAHINLNGTTDFITFYVRSISATCSVLNDTTLTYFKIHKI